MCTISEIFKIENAKSMSFSVYDKGKIPFVTNGTDLESSILGYIEATPYDRVFNEDAICLTSFGDAIIPPVPFLPRGNGGSGLIVLTPKKKMLKEEMYSYASQINMQKWRFSFSFMVTRQRISRIKLKKYISTCDIQKKIEQLSPRKIKKDNKQTLQNIKLINVVYNENNKNGLCEVSKNTTLPQNALENGDTPYITTSSLNNGASGFYEIEPNFKAKCLTLALNGSVGEVFFQFEDFVTSGDNAVLTLKDGYNPYLLFYIATMIRNHKWRYNYYRKLNLTKLNKMQIPIPYKNNQIDLEYIEQIVKNSYGYKEISKFL